MLNFKKMRFIFLIFIIISCSITNSYSQEKFLIDSINKVISSSEDTVKILAIINLGDLYEKIDFQKAVNLYKEAFELCNSIENNDNIDLQMQKKINNLKSITMLYIGVIYSDNNDFNNALIFLKKSRDIAIKSNNELRIIDCENYLGNVFVYKGDYEIAAKHYLNALKISEKINNLIGLSKATNNLGIIHYYLQNFDKSIEYYNKSIEACIKIKDNRGAAYTLNNIGNIYLKNNELDSALNYFHRAKIINEGLNDLKGLARCLNNIGIIHKRNNEYDKALKYYNEALQINYKNNDNQGISSCLNNIGIVYFENGKYDLSIEYANKNLEFASKANLKDEIKDAYNLLTDSYLQKHDYKSAFTFLKSANNIRDSLYNEEKTKAINEIDAKYQNEKKQLQIDNLEIDNKLKNSEIQKQKLLIYTFIIGFFIILIFSILLYWLFKQKKKANIILSIQKREIEEKNINLEFANAEILQQKEEILAQSELLEASNKELEKLSIAVSETDNSIIIADNEGNIEWVNSGFTRLLGYNLSEFKEIYGNNIKEVSSYNKIVTVIDDCVNSKQSANYISLNKTKNGNFIWVQTTITPILDTNNDVVKLIAIDSDITKVKDAETEIIKQKELIEIQNKEITDSIKYACNIQTAILPPDSLLKTLLGDYFILFKPKNIVSGDFYWVKKILLDNSQTLVLMSVVDCTGHGVPGALMSMLGISLLNEITNDSISVNNIELYTGTILDNLKENLIKLLHQTGSESESQDGIDMALCLINKNDDILYYSGANNPLYIISNNHLIEIKSDKMPVGYSHNTNHTNFSNNTYKYQSGDYIYLFSDGFADQFGGKSGKKIKYSGFKSIIEEIYKYPSQVQLEMLDFKISEWMNPINSEQYSQIDDITILGVKL